MTDVSITAAGAHPTATATDRIPSMQAGSSGYITPSQIAAYMETAGVVIGVGSGTSLTLGGAALGSNALAATGSIGIATGTSAPDVILSRGAAAATLQLGAPNAAAPVAQTLQVQSVVTGTADTAGVNWTFAGSKGTGTGAGGQIIFRTAPAAGTASTPNALATGLTITAPAVNMQPSVVVGNQAVATTATDGFLYIPGGAGAPVGTPTAFTGRYPLYWDTTDKKLYVYDGAWLGSTVPGVWS